MKEKKIYGITHYNTLVVQRSSKYKYWTSKVVGLYVCITYFILVTEVY